MTLTECPEPVWADAYASVQILEEPRKGSIKRVSKILYETLKKDVKEDVKSLLYAYRGEGLLDTLRTAYGPDWQSKIRQSPEYMHFIVDYAFFKRWQDVRDKKPNKFEINLGRK